MGPRGTREESTAPLPPETPEMCCICPYLILVSGVCTAPPTEDDKLKVFRSSGGMALPRERAGLSGVRLFPFLTGKQERTFHFTRLRGPCS